MPSTLFAIDLPRQHSRTIARAHYVQRLAGVLGNGQDWEYRGECIDLEHCTGKCSCGHHGLRFLFTIHHKKDGRSAIVGSTCVETYPGISQRLADQLTAEVARLEGIARKRAEKAKLERVIGPARLFDGLESEAGR